MATILYAVIANETSQTPLLEVSLAQGNFNLVIPQLLRTITHNSSMSYDYENKCIAHRYRFHTLNEEGLTFICMSDSDFPPHSAYAFLFDLRDQFTRKYGAQAKTAIGFSAKDFNQVVKERLTYFNNPNSDRVALAREKIEETRKIMVENLDKVLSRGEKIEILVDKTALMSDKSISMRRGATKVKQHFWWKNLRLSFLLFGILLVIVLIILLVLCGGFTFPNC